MGPEPWPLSLMGHICGRNRVVTRCPHMTSEERAALDLYWERVTSEMIADSILEAWSTGTRDCRVCGYPVTKYQHCRRH